MTGVAVATNTSGTAAAWLVGDGAGTGWPIAVGGDAVGRLGALGRADGLLLGEGLADGLVLAVGVGLAAAGLEATGAPGWEDAIAEAGDDAGAAGLETPEPAAGESDPAALPAVLLAAVSLALL